MSVSMYYTVAKKSPLTLKEREKIKAIIDKFNNDFTYKEEVEDLSLYNESSSDYALEGATKLPIHDEDMLIETVEYWLLALTEARLALPEATWSVSIDADEAKWINNCWEM